MNINLKLRFQNKTVLLALITCISAFVYQVLGILGVTAAITEDMVMQLAAAALNLLVTLGIVVDPTTKGVADSERAQGYEEPQ